MTAHSQFSNFGVSGVPTSGPWVSLCETNWGFIISSDTQWSNRAALIERVCAVAGIACLIAACMNWLFPSVDAVTQVADSTRYRIMSSLGMAMPALLFLWISDRGMGHEIQVDVQKQSLRQGVVNRKGKFRVQREVPFSEITSTYIKRCEGFGGCAQLHVRLGKGKRVLSLASGRESTMRVLHQRLTNELQPSRSPVRGWERVGRRLVPTGDEPVLAEA
ncbi:hypothetical protein [Actibacterium sp.]|uniref:hypothetical protein n=1 Tax=Actibacterium sp. TaxID=1872125 RepID=UPI003563ECFB